MHILVQRFQMVTCRTLLVVACLCVLLVSPVAAEQKVFVTGAAGFIGSHVMIALKRKGYAPIGLDNFNSYYSIALKRHRADFVLEETGVSIIDGDLCDAALLQSLFDKHEFSFIINLAAQPGVRYSFKNPMRYVTYNVECFTTLLEAVKTQYVQASRPIPRFLYASSSSVYGLNKKIPFSEADRVVTPSNLYGATKISNELIAHSYHHLYGINTVGFRFFTVYGPYGRPDMAAYLFTEKIIRGEPLVLFDRGEMMRDFTYVDDIVSGVISAVDRRPNDGYIVYNLGNTHPVKTGYFLEVLERLLNKKANYVHKKSVGEMEVTFSNISLAKDKLNYSPKVSIEEGLGRFVEWFKAYESKLMPCASSCSYENMCFNSGWDEAALKSRKLTQGCSIVFYTINTPPKADVLHVAPNSTISCNIAFVYIKSVLYQREKNSKYYNNWILIPVKGLAHFPDPRKATRVPKISPDGFFADSVRYALYGDSSIIARQTPENIVKRYSYDRSGKNAVITAIRHPSSKTILEEVQAVLSKTARQKNKVTHYPARLEEQGRAYESLRSVEKGLNFVNIFDGSFLVHKLQSTGAQTFRCMWYREYQLWADRDQVPGAFVLSRMNYDYNQKFGNKEPVVRSEWIPVYGERRSDNSVETLYFHVLPKALHPVRSRKIVLKEKFQYAYKKL